MRIRQIEVDTHTHSVLSGHAYSTIQENARAAVSRGLKAVCLTDHGPQIPGAAVYYACGMYPTMPETLEGVRMHYGLELNATDYEGGIDLSPKRLFLLQFALAGMHEVVIGRHSRQAHTNAYEKLLANPHIDAPSHPGSAHFDCDVATVVRAAKLFGKLIEINNHTFYTRRKNIPNCVEFAKECMKQDVRIIVSSDAHISTNVGVVDKAMAMLDEVGFPDALIANLTQESFDAYLQERKQRVAAHAKAIGYEMS